MRTALLNAVVIKGVAETDAVADATDVAAEEAGRILAELAESGLVRYRNGRLTGWSPTAEGRAELPRLIREEDLARPDESAYETFVEVNADFKRLCTDWQEVRPTVTAELTGRLSGVHDRVHAVVEAFTAAQPRFAAYDRRLTAARDRFLGGDADAMTGVGGDSYHGVWMELHADILTTLGRTRGERDGV